MSELDIRGLKKSFGTQRVLSGLNLRVEEGSFLSILGPSGSGKTTLLRVIAGFERADEGSVVLEGTVVDDVSHFVEPSQRRIGYVPQDGNLFPHLSVKSNVGFGLSRLERRGPRTDELLEMVGLEGFGDRYPHELSGGQQQRVALARGLAIRPNLMLLDEPFSSLDTRLRYSVRHDVLHVLKESGTTAVLVTHDQDEALSLSDRVAIIRDGQISQVDEPTRLYAHPESISLAKEFGETNFVPGVRHQRKVETVLGVLELSEDSATKSEDGAALIVLIRPEQIVVRAASSSGPTARVLDTEFYGHDAIIKLDLGADNPTHLTARTSQASQLPPRDTLVEIDIEGPVVAWTDV